MQTYQIKTFAENMKAARHKRLLSQEGAAAKLGIKRSTLGAYEEGRAEPPYAVLLTICRTYSVENIADFLTDPNYGRRNMLPGPKPKDFAQNFEQWKGSAEGLRALRDLVGIYGLPEPVAHSVLNATVGMEWEKHYPTAATCHRQPRLKSTT